MADPEVKLVESPRDAWQELKGHVPADVKVFFLRALIGLGFKHIDGVSFVSSPAMPQMADSEEVLKRLDPPDDVEIIGLVANEKGAQRAAETNAVRSLIFPYSVSPAFLMRNQHQTLEAACDELEKVKQTSDEAGLDTIADIAMAFGNPFGDMWSADEVVEAVGLLEQMGIHKVSLSDTSGMAGAALIGEVVSAVTSRYDYLEIGIRLHTRPSEAVEKIVAAYGAGARWFSSTIGGSAAPGTVQDGVVNLSTEKVLEGLVRLGLEPPIYKPLDNMIRMAAEIATRYKTAPETSRS